MATEHAPTASEYIVHHLTFFNNTGHAQKEIINWGVINYDSLFWMILLGAATVFFLYRVASRATSGVPGRTQAAVEFLVEMVADQAKGIVHSAESRRFVAPVALMVFIWILLMNTMDLIPVDLVPRIWAGIVGATGGDPAHAYMRIVPTADLSVTMGMSISVLLLCIYYNVKIKGARGWVHELFTAPFGNHFLLWPFNFVMQIIEFLAKTISHGMRLFGNMYAGELLFCLIALMGSTATVLGFAGNVVAGTLWAIFHILIIVLQAFIFMMLTLVYIGQAHEGH